MSLRQKVTLGCSSILYVLTIYAFFDDKHFSRPLHIIIFLLQSTSLLYFSYLCYKAHNDYTGAEHLQQEIGMLQAENRQLAGQLEEAGHAKEREVGTLRDRMHELENQMTLRESELSQTKEQLRAAESAEHQVSRELTEGVLLPEEEEASDPVDVIAVARATIGEFADRAREHGVQIRISSAMEALPVRAGQERLRILFRNIIDNSIKYMRREGSLIVTISSIDSDIFIVLKDTGRGLAEEETRHVFELNYQGSNRISGNGLGLAQARAIVEHYGGTIYARSTQDNGFAIYIQIPARTEEAEA